MNCQANKNIQSRSKGTYKRLFWKYLDNLKVTIWPQKSITKVCYGKVFRLGPRSLRKLLNKTQQSLRNPKTFPESLQGRHDNFYPDNAPQ